MRSARRLQPARSELHGRGRKIGLQLNYILCNSIGLQRLRDCNNARRRGYGIYNQLSPLADAIVHLPRNPVTPAGNPRPAA